ncbi:hypothetical protein SAMN05428950_103406 [Sphingomonas sp. OV641]|uniref:hypothetical protein n=1 Tax=Sphingomonas sp. OV641 TaxID=1881068 RepID=UPI0008AED851|nr:hypothetical protein [Sphingomonas sp. OV641]SEJ83513.1 hypothetical protein SAMN05428950_103406 [Sphingomonas sp. OV641]
MSNDVKASSPGETLGGCLVLLFLLAWIGSCVFDGKTDEEKRAEQAKAAQEQKARKNATQARLVSSGAARFNSDPLIAEGNRMSPDGDGFAYTIVVLGNQCNQTIHVSALAQPMTYEVICSNGSSGGRMNFVKYRLNTAAGISELLS